MIEKNNKALILIDNSYFNYCIMFGAQKEFTTNYPEESEEWIKPVKEVDQNNLPNLIDNLHFRQTLKSFTMKRIESIDYVLNTNCKDVVDTVDDVDVVFVIDDNIMNSFRKQLFPEYKLQRVAKPKQYNQSAIKKYISEVIYEELELKEKYGFRFIKVDGAESDDVIATMAKQYKDVYHDVIIIASDHDFLQLEGVQQYDIYGKHIVRNIAGEEVNPQDYLLHKILIGDKSDNIPNVFHRVGEKKAMAYVKDKSLLKLTLAGDSEAAEKYANNRKLISFEYIPKELTESIISSTDKLITEFQTMEKPVRIKASNLSEFMVDL